MYPNIYNMRDKLRLRCVFDKACKVLRALTSHPLYRIILQANPGAAGFTERRQGKAANLGITG